MSSSSSVWLETHGAVPRFVVQMLPVDKKSNLLLMHRSDKVRSAKNVWSFPSGLQEVGEYWTAAAARELQEEYELEVQRLRVISVYENIGGDDPSQPQYHWVILLVAALVDDVKAAVNKEPDKHDEMRIITIDEILDVEFTNRYQFHRSFRNYLRVPSNAKHAHQKLTEVINDKI